MALDVEDIVRRWISNRTDLSGPGKPLTRGALLKHSRSEGCYAFIIAVGTPNDLTAERSVGRARISATIHGRTKEVAAKAAVAYATVLESLKGAPEQAGDYKILVVDNISGPLPLDDHLTTREEFRYLVDADFWLSV
jgi:hypothetical protein